MLDPREGEKEQGRTDEALDHLKSGHAFRQRAAKGREKRGLCILPVHADYQTCAARDT